MTTDWRNILVHLDGAEGAANRLLMGRRLAVDHQARLAALHAAIPAGLLVPVGGEGAAAMSESLAQLDTDRRDGSRSAFDAVQGEAGVDASWGELTGVTAEDDFIRAAMLADVVVLGQHDPAAAALSGMPAAFAERVLARSGRPCIVVPYAIPAGGPLATVVVAWKETPEAVRAVVAALPLLRNASRVHVLTWGGTHAAAPGPLADLPAWLAAHDVPASASHSEGGEPGDLGDLLLSRCADLGGDLLVMGCYGHSRAREWLLGGASRTVLSSMTLPVCMAH
jgi:nucleotide-binding universal stress UspA family protein